MVTGRAGTDSTQELEPERPQAGHQILFYNPAAGEPIYMSGFCGPHESSSRMRNQIVSRARTHTFHMGVLACA
jgi:hypothetical protein